MSKIKEILCLHHSHLDVGYTHPQNLLLELQGDYIEQAIDLCIKTADYPEESRFRWTCEANYPLLLWLQAAQPKRIELFRRLVKDGFISVTAMPMHTTPGCSLPQLSWFFQHLDRIRELTGSDITTAINHDVNGQPWTMAPLLLDSGVRFYITGINIHFGGIPFPRPYAFGWDTQDGRSLPTFLGEHYSLFSQFLSTHCNSTAKMHEGVCQYVERMENSGWQGDFLYLTATNPPLYDNNCPDANLADLIRRYNAEGHEQTIRFVTPEILYQYVQKMEPLPHHAGDWTDYWNFGSASTARELKINRRAKNRLAKADFLACMEKEPSAPRLGSLTENAYWNTVLFDEHTWGASESVSRPDQEETYAQLNHKKDFSYKAAELSAYVLGSRMEKAAANPFQADAQEGLLVVNPTPFPVEQRLKASAFALCPGRNLSAIRIKDYLPYEKEEDPTVDLGSITLPPFSAKTVPFSVCKTETDHDPGHFQIREDGVDTPFYQISMDPVNKRIRQIYDKKNQHVLLGEEPAWGFFDLVEERIDRRYAPAERRTFFPRDVEKGNRSISQWNHDWKAVREGIEEFRGAEITETADSLSICYSYASKSLSRLEQKITFSASHPRIGLDALLVKDPSTEPESLFFAFPLSLKEGWECCYDTAGSYVRLDQEQLGKVCRDYITVDKTISFYDQSFGYTLACPDAPLIQPNGFQFGKENARIERQADPLLLAWPINNYWDTNFASSQEGKMSFHYELSTFRTFREMDALEAGLLAEGALITGAAITCAAESCTTFLQYEGEECAPLFLRPWPDGDGILVAVKNFRGCENVCRISFPDRVVSYAALTDLQGKTRTPLTIGEAGISVPLFSHQLAFLKIRLRSLPET